MCIVSHLLLATILHGHIWHTHKHTHTHATQLSIWDTAGVERFRTLTRNYYRNAHAAVFVYSMADAVTLHYLSQWIKDTGNFAPNALRMLIGNKSDLDPGVDDTTIKQFAQLHEFELQFQMSCKKNTGIVEAFDELARTLHKYPEGRHHDVEGAEGQSVVAPNGTRSRSSNCC